jgi:hypothetical protein
LNVKKSSKDSGMPGTDDTYGEQPLDEKVASEIIRGLWSGLCGQQEQARRAIERLARATEARLPYFASRCRRLLTQAVPPTTSMRETPGFRTSHAPTPDSGTRLSHLLVEENPKLHLEPRWDASVTHALERLVAERKMRDLLAAKNLVPTRTALFVGAPGQGKTLAARWTAGQLGLPLHVVNLASVMSSYLGRTGANLQELMAAASQEPCVLLIDELDCLAKRRGDASDVGEMNRLVTVLLQQLDSWSDQSLLIAATNHPDLLDPAVWRRFEVVVQFPAPTKDDLIHLARQVLGSEEAQATKAGMDALIAAHADGSYSDFTTALLRARRTAIITDKPLNEILVEAAAQRVAQQPNKTSKKQVATALREVGWTERQIRDLTGLSRDVIRTLPGGRRRG